MSFVFFLVFFFLFSYFLSSVYLCGCLWDWVLLVSMHTLGAFVFVNTEYMRLCHYSIITWKTTKSYEVDTIKCHFKGALRGISVDDSQLDIEGLKLPSLKRQFDWDYYSKTGFQFALPTNPSTPSSLSTSRANLPVTTLRSASAPSTKAQNLVLLFEPIFPCPGRVWAARTLSFGGLALRTIATDIQTRCC